MFRLVLKFTLRLTVQLNSSTQMSNTRHLTVHETYRVKGDSNTNGLISDGQIKE